MVSRFFRQMVFGYKDIFAIYGISGYIMFKLINPFFHMMLYTMIARYVYGETDIDTWVIGNAMILCSFTAFFSVGQVFIRERWQGTLGLLVNAPTKMTSIVMPRVVVLLIDSFISIGVGFAVGVLFFGLNLVGISWMLILVIITIAIIATFGLGILIGVFGLLTRDIFLLLNFCSYILIALTGVNFYVDLLPEPLQFVSNCLPLTRSIDILRKLMAGSLYIDFDYLLWSELGIGVLYMIVALLLYRHIEKRAMKTATIDLY